MGTGVESRHHMKSMSNKKRQSGARKKRAAVRRRKRTYNYSVSNMIPRLRSGTSCISRSRVLALLVLLAMVALLAWFSLDTCFFIYEAEVQGNALISADEVYRASGLHTLSVFFVDQAQVAERIRQHVPSVAQVHVGCQLPNRVCIRICEREVRFVWHTRGTAFLVDGEGQVLKVDDGAHGALLPIRDLADQPLQPGDQVDRVAVNAASGLHRLLPQVKAFDYSKAKGISWLDARGWRIYFGDDQALAEKVAGMHAVLQKIASSGASVEFIDLRFVGSPCYK